MQSSIEIRKVAEKRAGRPKSAEKRAAIREAGSHLFLARGLDDVSMDEIAEAAGVSKQTVYSHFGSKEDLFRACIRSKLEQYSLSTEDIPEGVPPLAALEVMAGRFLDLISDPDVIAMHRAVIAQSTHHPEVARLFYDTGPQQTIDAIRRIFEAASAAGTLAVPDCDEAAELFLSMLKGIADLRCMVNVGAPMAPAERPARAARVVTLVEAMYAP